MQPVLDPAAAGRPHRVRPIDFSRPTKFTPEQERRLRRVVEDFCRAAAGRLSAEVRIAAELEVTSATQLAWADAHTTIADDAIAAAIAGGAGGTPLLLCLEQPLVLRVIEGLLGGVTAEPVPARRLTEIDWALGGHFADRLVGQLAPVWADAFDLALERTAVDAAADLVALTQVSEPTLTVACELRLGGEPHQFWLLVPWTAFAPVAERLERSERETEPVDGGPIAGAMAGIVMTLRAEAGAARMALTDVLDLAPGDVIRLDAHVADGVTLYAGDAPVRRAVPGASNGRRAVQVGDA